MAKVRWAVPCCAHSKRTGLPCRAWSITGGYVCWSHGGAIGAVQRKAAERLVLSRAVRKLENKLGRELKSMEAAYLAGSVTGDFRDMRRLQRELKADAKIALARLKASLET